MKNKLRFIYLISALTLVLSACGTTDKNEIEPTQGNEVKTPETEVTENEATDETQPEVEESAEEDELVTGAEDNGTKDHDAAEKSEETGDLDADFTADTTIVDSDEQEFSMNVLPNYKLTSEEPGRDILSLEADDTIFMRIETMLDEEDTYDYLAENMLVVLEASGDGTKPVEVTNTDLLPTNKELEDVQAYQVDNNGVSVTGVLFKQGDLIVRLTIFDSAQAKYYSDFLHMGQTVTAK